MRIIIKAVAFLSVFIGCDSPDSRSNNNDGVIAYLEGEELHLADGWGDATSCVVWQGTTECFRQEIEAEEMIREIEAVGGPDSLTSPDSEPLYACARQCLHLYEHNGFNGRHLTFCDRGYWQNLSKYNFNDRLSSYKTGVHGVHLSYHHSGGGNWYPGDTSSCVSNSQMKSGWNDEVSAIRIN
jgi:hypothetical protein